MNTKRTKTATNEKGNIIATDENGPTKEAAYPTGAGEEEDDMQDHGDVRTMTKMIDPCLPSRAEIEEHRLTHLPYRN